MTVVEVVALLRGLPGVADLHPVRSVLPPRPGADPDEGLLRVRVRTDHVEAEVVLATAAGSGAHPTASAVADLLRERLAAEHPGREVRVRVRVVDVG